MSIIRIKDCVPSNYVSESRDFQLFTRVLDFTQNSIKNNIDSIVDTVDTNTIPSIYLNNLKSKLGFFTRHNYSDATLRKVLLSFPQIIRHKGSSEGIEMCINTFMTVLGVRDGHIVKINENDDYTVEIGLEIDIQDISLLEELLSYVIPTGYFVKFYFYTEATPGEGFPKYRFEQQTHPHYYNTPVVRSEEYTNENENDGYNTVQVTAVYNNEEGDLNNDE